MCGKMRILYYKQPSRTYECNYKEIIDELWTLMNYGSMKSVAIPI